MPATGRPAAADALAGWLGDPRRAALLTDFDGTLAPIVVDPEAAVPLPAALPVLADLTGSLGVVAVVSGRPVRFLRQRLAGVADRLVLVGLYGLEWAEQGAVRSHPEAEPWRPAVAAAVRDASWAAPGGVTVEDKGLAVTIHARRSPHRYPWVEEFGAATAERLGLAAHPGRLSMELRPPVAVDKGTVVASLSEGMAAACYIGDDRGDLPAFAALDRRRATGMATLAVAASSDEAPPELLGAADLVVDGPEGTLALLATLAELAG